MCRNNFHAEIVCVENSMNYPQDAIKDAFEHNPDFCYDCCAPLDECVCEPDLSGENGDTKERGMARQRSKSDPAIQSDNSGNSVARQPISPAQIFPVPVLAEPIQELKTTEHSGEIVHNGEARESISPKTADVREADSRGGENSLQWPSLEEQIAHWILKDEEQGPMENLLDGLDQQSDALSSDQLKAELQGRGIDIDPCLAWIDKMLRQHLQNNNSQ